MLAREFKNICTNGAIINFLDARMSDYEPNHISYQLSKQMLFNLTRMMSLEFAPGIRVNAVAPGFIKSEMSDSMPEEVIKAGIAMIPVKRIGTPEDMGYAYLFLASKEAGFVSGHTLHANGGSMPS